MNQLFDHEAVQWILASLMGVLILGVFGWLKFKRDEKVVARFLKESGLEARRILKTTSEISTATNIHEERVRKVCKKSARIKREDGSWKLHG